MKRGWQVRLLCPWARHLTGLPLPLSCLTGSNRWQLDSKTEKIPLLSPGRGTLTNKWVPKPIAIAILQRPRYNFLALFEEFLNILFSARMMGMGLPNRAFLHGGDRSMIQPSKRWVRVKFAINLEVTAILKFYSLRNKF